MSSKLFMGGALLLAALAGGGVAVGIGAAVDEGSTTTVVQEVRDQAAPAPATFNDDGSGKSIQDIYREAGPGVVGIFSTQIVSDDPFFGPQSVPAQGSGFVIDKAGHIITNYHVVEGASEVFVSFSENERIRAEIVGSDPSTDIAVLQIDVRARALSPLVLGDSDAVEVGDPVVAIGNPLGLERTVTAGIVSALQREITAPNGITIDRVIQTDAPINPGNSGGPLLNTTGEVIGVNSQIAPDPEGGRGNIGIGFAVPIDTVKEVVSQILETGRVDHAYLGVQVQTVDPAIAESIRLPVDEGVLVAAVQPDSPAEAAGLKGGNTTVVVNGVTYVLGGDVIVGIDGEPMKTADDVRHVVRSKRPGDVVSIQINRDGTEKTLRVELGRQPSAPAG
jgi:S1-C subfamily serine protease